MKLKLTIIIALLAVGVTTAQTKVGTVDMDFIIGKMPEMQKVLERVKNYGAKLDSTFQVKFKGYKAKVDDFSKNGKQLSDEEKKKRYQEIVGMEQEMKQFRQNGTQLMQLRRDELMRPLYKKVSGIIAQISKANGYTQILTTTGNQFAYIDERFDLTKQILAKLGIKLEAAKK